jgi:hypothetical protein
MLARLVLYHKVTLVLRKFSILDFPIRDVQPVC